MISPHPRIWLMTIASTAWSVRLTYNFTRRGGYGWPPWTGEEDYRWEYVRKWPIIRTKIGASLFNLTFISLYQNVLLLLTATPVLICSEYNRAINVVDVMLMVSCLLLVYIEYT